MSLEDVVRPDLDFALSPLPDLYDVLAEFREIGPAIPVKFATRPLWMIVGFEAVRAAMTAEDTNDLFYRYFLGAETSWKEYAVGGYFYHRSNHTISAPNDEVTSINVLEAGIETSRWNRPPLPDSIGDHGSVSFGPIGFARLPGV